MAAFIFSAVLLTVCQSLTLGSVIPQPSGLNAFKVGHADTVVEPLPSPVFGPVFPYGPPPPPPIVPAVPYFPPPPPPPVVPLPLPLPGPVHPALPPPVYPAVVPPPPPPPPVVPEAPPAYPPVIPVVAPPPPPPPIVPVVPAPAPYWPPAPPPVLPALLPGPAFGDGFYGPFPYPYGVGRRFYGTAAVPAHLDESIRFPGVKVPVPSLPFKKN